MSANVRWLIALPLILRAFRTPLLSQPAVLLFRGSLTLNFNFPARGKITGQLKFGDSKANLEYENNQVVISGDANFLVEMKNSESITAGDLAKRLIGVLEQHKTSEGGFGTFYYRSNEEEYTGSFHSGGTGISALFVAQRKQ